MIGDNHFAMPNRDAEAEMRAVLYLSGAMTPTEREKFEHALSMGDEALRDEVRRLQTAAEALANTVEPVHPPAAARERLLQNIETVSGNHVGFEAQSPTNQIWRRWSSDDSIAFFTLRAGEGAWEETGVAGVQVRRLFVDRPSNRMTAMFRMAAGADYPEHVHDGPEECYVLQGDLHVGDDFVMNAGDYQRALPGSEHGRQWTERGCLLLVTCSLSDDMM